MINFPATQSLLPWLDTKASKIHLSIPFNTNYPHKPGKTLAGFMVRDASSAVANLIDASFSLDSQNTIKKFFLLVQKDQYSFTEKNVPLDNKGIDQLWEETFELYSVGKASSPFISLPGPAEDGPSLPLWKSLFYCTEQKCFFHPPCPKCGNLLELCTDENILAAANLPLYASSLERFLFCSACHGADKGRADFFVYEETGAGRPMVKNRWTLINEFGRLLEGGQLVSGFPCLTCNNRHACFKAEKSAGSKIVPFAFYPFRMLLTDAMQIHAHDFLSLISGAASDEIKNKIDCASEPGRTRALDDLCGQGAKRLKFFFENDPRHFLEILYLKLAFLKQINETALSDHGDIIHPDLRPSLDHYWVNLADYEGLLPYFWNFKVRPQAVGLAPQQEASFVRVPQALSLYAMAVLWFHSLLANNKQTVADIQRALAPFLSDENIEDDELDFGALVTQKADKTFLAENIFWHPKPGVIPAPWLTLWQEALNLGWTLLRASYHADHQFSLGSFLKQTADTAAKVKNSLFAAPPAPTTVPKEKTAAEDGPISNILFSIMEKWQAGQPPTKIAAPSVPVAEPQTASQEEEVEKTVIMTADQVSALLAEQQSTAKACEPEEGKTSATGGQTIDQEPPEEVEKTVIMNINDIQALVANQPPAPEPESAAKIEHEPPPAPAEKGTRAAPQASNLGEDNLSETVMISAEQLEKLRKAPKG